MLHCNCSHCLLTLHRHHRIIFLSKLSTELIDSNLIKIAERCNVWYRGITKQAFLAHYANFPYVWLTDSLISLPTNFVSTFLKRSLPKLCFWFSPALLLVYVSGLNTGGIHLAIKLCFYTFKIQRSIISAITVSAAHNYQGYNSDS